ncbi:MAG: PKD domain-containing protein, partial [Bacteroidales bacterium]|nr:PKD domain-containing protein [Bacteroidales bacterium]
MIKFSKYILVILVGFQLVFSGCEEDNYELGELITPTNVDVTFEVVGADGENPNGDGSGVVNFSATADNEITFNYIFGDGKNNEIAADGNIAHQFSKNGVNTYNVTVIAVGTGGVSASKTVQVEVFSSFTDDEALEFLTGGSSKTWYWAADQQGHVGLGPNFEDAGKTFAAWYQAAPFEKT